MLNFDACLPLSFVFNSTKMHTLVKCCIMRCFIWVFTVCQSTCLHVHVSRMKRVLRVKYKKNISYTVQRLITHYQERTSVSINDGNIYSTFNKENESYLKSDTFLSTICSRL